MSVMLVFILAGLYGFSNADIAIGCFPGRVDFNVTGADAVTYDGFKVGLLDGASGVCEATLVGDSSLQTASLTCTNYVLVTATCNADTNLAVLFTETVQVTAPTPSIDATASLEAVVDMIVPSYVSLGETVTVTFITNVPEYASFLLSVYSLSIDFNLDGTPDVTLISEGCTDEDIITENLNIASTSGAATATASFAAFVQYKDDVPLSTSTPFYISAEFDLCSSSDASACEYTCDGSGAGPERKKRSAARVAASQSGTVMSEKIRVFLNDELKEEYLASGQNQQAAATASPVSDNTMCVNKTVFGLIIGLVIIGMLACLIATICMFTKMKQSRKFASRSRSTSGRINPTFYKM